MRAEFKGVMLAAGLAGLVAATVDYAYAQGYGGGGFPGGGGGKGTGLLNALYCQLAGCTITGTVAVTGAPAAGVGAVKIRPTGDDLVQIQLCDDQSNASPEVCGHAQHFNASATSSSYFMGANVYVTTSLAFGRNNTGFGGPYVYTVASTTTNSNGFYLGTLNTSGTNIPMFECFLTSATTATCTLGSAHTVTLDAKGPIINSAGSVVVSDNLNYLLLSTATNCADSAGDAACTAAPAGRVVVDAADTTTVVSTTAVTANSTVMVRSCPYLSTALSVTCNTANLVFPEVTSITAATSFTITTYAFATGSALAPATNPLCVCYEILN